MNQKKYYICQMSMIKGKKYIVIDKGNKTISIYRSVREFNRQFGFKHWKVYYHREGSSTYEDDKYILFQVEEYELIFKGALLMAYYQYIIKNKPMKFVKFLAEFKRGE